MKITPASGSAKREAAQAMWRRRNNRTKRATVGADKGDDSKAFIEGCRKLKSCRKLKVTPHVAAKDRHSAVDGRIKRHEGYKTSLKVRKRIEDFDWIKTVGGLAKTKPIGQAKLMGQGAAVLCHLQLDAQEQHRRLVERTSCVSSGTRAPEMGKMACKQVEITIRAAVWTLQIGSLF